MFQISRGQENIITLLMQNGSIPHGYSTTQGVSRRISNEEWQQLLESGSGYPVKFDPMPSATLLPQKILLEYRGQGEEKPLLTSQLASLVHASEKGQSASIQHIRWQKAEAFIISSGSDLSHRKAILTAEDFLLESSDALQQIFTWHEKECIVTTYMGGIESPTWLEVYLNILFEWSCNHILEQYGYLTGRVMINSVIRNLLLKATFENWELTGTDGRVLAHTIFASPAKAGEVYRIMLETIYKSIEPIIGPALLFSIQRQVNNLCKGNYSSIARMYELF